VRRLAVLDLDYCILDTLKFAEAVDLAINRAFGIPVMKFRSERQDRRPSAPGRLGDGEGYSTGKHLFEHYRIDEAEALQNLSVQLDHETDWLYPGAIEMIQGLQEERGYTVVLVTVGAPGPQAFKITLAGLSFLPFYTVEENKGIWLASQWPPKSFPFDGTHYDEAVVICDCPQTHQALLGIERPGLTCVQVLARPKYPLAGLVPGALGVKELDEILPALSALRV
jgi:hypothetical protein